MCIKRPTQMEARAQQQQQPGSALLHAVPGMQPALNLRSACVLDASIITETRLTCLGQQSSWLWQGSEACARLPAANMQPSPQMDSTAPQRALTLGRRVEWQAGSPPGS